jgi:hypothetical protein
VIDVRRDPHDARSRREATRSLGSLWPFRAGESADGRGFRHGGHLRCPRWPWRTLRSLCTLRSLWAWAALSSLGLFRAVERGHGGGVSVAGCVVRGLSGGLVLRGLVDGVTVAV